jgi:hypothetical protein
MEHNVMSASARWRSPVFIAGPSRSGTTMLSKMLSRHSAMKIVPEVHFFDDLRPRLRAARIDGLSAAELDAAVDYFRALSHRTYGRRGDPERGWLTRAALLERAEAGGGGVERLLEAFCQLQVERNHPEAAVWGEKTPRNAFHIDEILAAFPDARVIVMLRDPRACVASYRDWTYQSDGGALESDADYVAAVKADIDRARLSYHIVIAALLWRATANLALEAADRHGERVRVLRYEDVVADPAAALAPVCGWIGLDFEPGMLEVPLVNSSYAFSAQGGVSRLPSERWRGKLTDHEVSVIQKLAARAMERAGYPPEPVRSGPLDLPRAYAGLPLVAARAVAANRSRVANVPAYAWRRLRAALK